MNLIGHLAVARRVRSEPAARGADPRFLLGAMLPDLAGMLGLRIGRVADPVVTRGVIFHALTDTAFHECAEFARLLIEARARLRAAGVARGTMLAASHVGVEFLLDGVLSENASIRDDVRRALAVDRLDEKLDVVWLDRAGRPPPAPPHWRRLRLQVGTDRFLRGYSRPEEVGDRLLRVLARRPRLAASTRDAEVVRDWLLAAQPDVRIATPRLFGQVIEAIQRTWSRAAAKPPEDGLCGARERFFLP